MPSIIKAKSLPERKTMADLNKDVSAAMAARDVELTHRSAVEYAARFTDIQIRAEIELAFICGASLGAQLKYESAMEIINDVFRKAAK